MRRVGVPEVTGGVRIASLLDIAATKVKVLGDRASYKDYLDIAAILETGVALDQCVGAAQTVYGAAFNPMPSLKALCFFDDLDSPDLVPAGTRRKLCDAARTAGANTIPIVPPLGELG